MCHPVAAARWPCDWDVYDFPSWLWSCLRTEWLSPEERIAVERLRALFGSFDVELDALGTEHDPDGVAAHRNGVHVGGELRRRSDPKGMYDALFRLRRQVARARPAAA